MVQIAPRNVARRCAIGSATCHRTSGVNFAGTSSRSSATSDAMLPTIVPFGRTNAPLPSS